MSKGNWLLRLCLGIMCSFCVMPVFSTESTAETTAKTTAECRLDCEQKIPASLQKYVDRDSLAVSIYLDNDIFTGDNKDKDYSAGIAVAFSGPAAATHPTSINGALTFINHYSGIETLFENDDLTLNTFEIGLAIFTPEDLEVEYRIRDDRPYASLLYIANTEQHLLLEDRKAWMSTVSFGFLGLQAFSWLQNSIHHAVSTDIAEGWDNQISNGGELTFKYSLSRQQYHEVNSEHLQLTTAAGMSIGYITEVFYGANFRIGLLRTPWWSFNVYTSNYGEKANITLPVSRYFDEIYFIAGTNVRLRAYNVFLQGQFRESEVTYSASEIEPVIYEGWMGVGAEVSSGWRLSYIVRLQSSEVKEGLSDDAFNYGELNASYKF